jgi:hypothetical protein
VADNFLQFAATIENLTEEEDAWVLDQQRIESGEDRPKFLRAHPELDVYGDGTLDIRVDVIRDGEAGAQTRRLWIYSDEGVELEQLGHFLQAFLQKFRPDEHFTLTYAEWCTKLQVGAFGGGALWIDAQRILWHHVQDWLDEQRHKSGTPDPREGSPDATGDPEGLRPGRPASDLQVG